LEFPDHGGRRYQRNSPQHGQQRHSEDDAEHQEEDHRQRRIKKVILRLEEKSKHERISHFDNKYPAAYCYIFNENAVFRLCHFAILLKGRFCCHFVVSFVVDIRELRTLESLTANSFK